MNSTAGRGSVDDQDIVQFERLGAEWWDEAGSMGALHKLNPTRIRYIRDRVAAHFGPTVGGDTDRGTLPLAGMSILDIGCGGGLLSEPLTRLGARVTGVDPAPGNIAIARRHAEATGLRIDYRDVTVEDVAATSERFDVVIASEVVEHVLDQPAFMATACSLVKPRGLLLVSTLNRTAKCFLLAIVGAEYVLGWLPRGTHKWDRFVRPSELARWTGAVGFRPLDQSGMIFDPLKNDWRLGRDTDVNYWFAAARKEPVSGRSG
ncbi:bifunctional 2-polyprenyl-6-hydroxyphenol methylase/3-demethylubiquinol 3-O-methyltransferase UbiG [Lichenifustis flavocetrariae]|uniref:Ubiquinone biosynthesis O-methyltransferase n=1 Tax=Lichenifustis flavocetrariae TaxID=2949735 RepID=A0AA42CLP7_9HYPH|nr:bifunctional 2-polyprenyl-6-hydroxyphenol methylase/3-demethylubiquinol 3-O-methyltransferase UbiG [Lichenifustis flavocetrariae]MCW6510651.1 bifunctional 2-polyprenyl-6-hydroxyphenol methylase/3-demethylubiquinol 3-O-methyltransferase UbiG [Lichenifustis flavocetrariae]